MDFIQVFCKTGTWSGALRTLTLDVYYPRGSEYCGLHIGICRLTSCLAAAESINAWRTLPFGQMAQLTRLIVTVPRFASPHPDDSSFATRFIGLVLARLPLSLEQLELQMGTVRSDPADLEAAVANGLRRMPWMALWHRVLQSPNLATVTLTLGCHSRDGKSGWSPLRLQSVTTPCQCVYGMSKSSYVVGAHSL